MKILNFAQLQGAGKKNLFLIPFFFTFASAFCGLVSVIKTLDEQYMFAALLIVLAALFDLCDGRLARMFNVTSLIGMELDSLCDAVSFCFAPAILLYSWSLAQLGTAGMLVLGLYLCCGLFRLARFNTVATSNNASFSGLPTTIAAFFLANIVIYEQWLSRSMFASILRPEGIAFLVTCVALLMISSIKFPSAKHIKIQLATSGTFLMLAIVAIWSLVHGYPFFLVISVIYIVASFLFSIFKEITRFWWQG
jgi:CDP-diacylglycerol---serine O-phosphatidyltransferase